MNKWMYIFYVVIVIAIVVVAGSDDRDSREWGGSTGRSGWGSAGGHK